MDEFEHVYEERVRPFLAANGFRESRQRGRATIDSVYSRLYAFNSVKAYLDARKEMDGLAEWDSVRVSLGERFGAARNSTRIRARLSVYTTPAQLDSVVVGARGKSRQSGPGRAQWRRYDVTDGLSGPMVNTILESDDGSLWFGTRNNGISRYNGDTWIPYRKADGLPDDRIRRGLCDSQGRLWFATLSGLCRYEAGRWTRFDSEEHPLRGLIWPLLEDRSGNLWFGSYDGIIRWDGEEAVRYRKEDGLAGSLVLGGTQDRSGRYWFATTEGVSCLDPAVSSESGADLWIAYDKESGLPDNVTQAVIEDAAGSIWVATQGGPAVFDGGSWRRFTLRDGLPGIVISAAMLDREGRVWLGCQGGAAVYNGDRFESFRTGGGLVNNEVYTIHQDREGHVWFGTAGGVSQYAGRTWRTFRAADGLAHDEVGAGMRDSSGNLWFATGRNQRPGSGGVSRFDGERWTLYGKRDGLSGETVYGFCETPEGDIWVATDHGATRMRFADDGTATVSSLGARHGLMTGAVVAVAPHPQGGVWLASYGDGLAHFDGGSLTMYGPEDGLAGDQAQYVYLDTDDAVWYAGLGGGLSRMRGGRVTTYTAEDGLPHNEVIVVTRDREDRLWIGTHGGICRVEGDRFVSITADDGLVSNDVHAIYQSEDGVLWVGTDGGGISLYDGRVFQTLTEEDGLGSNVVMSILDDVEGNVWVGTSYGVTRFRRPEETAPHVVITAVVAGDRHTGPEVTVTSSQRLVTFEFAGTCTKTVPGGLVYRYRLAGLDPEWRTTRERRVDYRSIPAGYYSFEVFAIDRDLVYSESPARVQVNVTLPYARLALVGGLAIAVVAFGVTLASALKRRRERDRAKQDLIKAQARLVEEMDRELRTAHEMQMGLLPKLPPAAEGFLMAGTCLPASHVGGDYYNFVELDDGGDRVAVVVADVSGHGMQAATVTMRFNEMLRYEIRGKASAKDILVGLDDTLRGQIPPEMFVTCGIGILDATDRVFSFASAACPEVYHYSHVTESVRSLGLSGYPLGLPYGLRKDKPYGTAQLTLSPGDVVVIASDGVEDAQNSLGAFYEGARLKALITQMGGKGVRPETIRDEIVSDVRRFMGEIQQPDDITVVVVQARGAEEV